MRAGARRWALLLGALVVRVAPAADDDAPWQGSGRLTMPNHHPFASIFLDAPLLDARLPRRPRFAVHATESSTMTLSPNIKATPSGAALVAAWEAGRPQQPLNVVSLKQFAGTHPRETYLFADAETTTVTLDYTVPFSRRWGLAVEVPLVTHWGGLFDSAIADFHQTFGFGSLGRQYAPGNYTQLCVAQGQQSRFCGGQRSPLLGDLTLRGLYAPLRETRRVPGLLLAANLKAPTGAASEFAGSGGWDVGGCATLGKTWGRWRAEVAAGYSVHSRWSGLSNVPLSNTFDLHLCGEYKVDDEWAILTQLSRTENALRHASPETFGRHSWRLGAAARAMVGRRVRVEMAFVDNVAENDNTEDASIQTSLRWDLP